MRELDEIRIVASKLRKGQTECFLCPFCRGGRSGERKFYVTRKEDGNTAYCCLRASCGRSGYLGGRDVVGGSGYSETTTEGPRTRTYKGATMPLGKINIAILRGRFGFVKSDASRAGLVEDQDSGAIVVPIRGIRGQHIGTYLRSFGVRGDDLYNECGGVLQGWFFTPNEVSDSILLVEDPFSAIKVARQFTSVCLFGTNLSPEGIEQILQFRRDRAKQTGEGLLKIILALDRDAYGKALSLARRYRFLVPDLRVVRLDRDLKYESDERISQLVDET